VADQYLCRYSLCVSLLPAAAAASVGRLAVTPLAAALVGAVYVFCLVRDLPRGLTWQAGSYATVFVAANTIVVIVRVGA
jgi:hypothetical protein